MAKLKNVDDFEREFGPAKDSFDLPPVSAKEIELYGMKPSIRQWTFEPPDSLLSYGLQLMADGTYQKSLSPRHKQSKELNKRNEVDD